MLRTALRPLAPLPRTSFARSYALSRYPDRTLRFGRTSRLNSHPQPSRSASSDPSQSSGSSSTAQAGNAQEQLWAEATQRAPSGDTNEALRRLVMDHDTLVVTRQIEMLNVFVGFEQANRYAISSLDGVPLGYIAEADSGMSSALTRQLLRTHRPFHAVIMDNNGTPILWLRRPFSWINSRMRVQRQNSDSDEDAEPELDTLGEVQQRWDIFRRKYEVFLREPSRRVLALADSDEKGEPELDGESYAQLAQIDEPPLSWDFTLRDADGQPIASMSKKLRGLAREIFTDTSQYYINFKPREFEMGDDGSLIVRELEGARQLSLEERAIVLATAVNVDVDYFSRHSR
ncbi:Scramblase-domain-containing protein [Peniophora sp. CONT]|nr:Scramblase-domain-containing protein [Peniophora sp. CONT]